MRTTLTLDDDVLTRVREVCRRTGEPLKVAVNRLLRTGLLAERRPEGLARFHVDARPLCVQPGVSLDSIADLLERLDGPGHA